MATLILRNQTDGVICYVYISPVESDEWGEDWLGEAETIGSGGSREFSVPAGTYDLRAEDCDGNPLDEQREVELSGVMEWTISGTVGGGALDFSAEPTFGSVELTAGFAPDPYTVDMISGGDVDVSTQGLGSDCLGYAATAPDLRLQWTGDSPNLRIFFVADGGEDTTLIVNDANGTWHCNDDSPFGGVDPLVDIPSPPEGQYDIWVGSYEAGAYVEGTLYITEMDIYPGNLTGGGAQPSGIVLLQDDFSNPNSGWSTGDYENGSIAYAGGAYVIRGESEDIMIWGTPGGSFTDVVIDVDATQVLGPPNNNNAYGIFCRVQPGDTGDGYAFLISGDGYYSIQRIVGGDYEALVQWTPSDVVRQGNVSNHIRAICDGTYLGLVVNGQLVAEANDGTYTSGDVGLVAGSGEPEPTEIHFDNLVVTAP